MYSKKTICHSAVDRRLGCIITTYCTISCLVTPSAPELFTFKLQEISFPFNFSSLFGICFLFQSTFSSSLTYCRYKLFNSIPHDLFTHNLQLLPPLLIYIYIFSCVPSLSATSPQYICLLLPYSCLSPLCCASTLIVE